MSRRSAPSAAAFARKLAAIGLAACGLAACSLAPDYFRPDTPPPPAYKEANAPAGNQQVGEWTLAAPKDGQARGLWWRVYGDPRLDRLEAQVTSANQDLKAAFARLVQARAAAKFARGSLYPTVTGGGGVTRNQTSSTIANTFHHNAFYDYLAEGDLSYEIDVFGRVRNTIAAAKHNAEASAADLATLDLSLHAELATDYFTLRGDDSQQAILDQTVTDYAKALQLTVDRYRGGVAAEADVAQAQTQLETAKTEAADIRLRRAQLEHAIAILTGKPPAEFSLPHAPLDARPPAIDPGLPSMLLERRPDVAAAERRVAAANAEIGVARAAYYPVFSIDAVLGLESAVPSRWMTAPSRLWSFGPSAIMTLIDGGQRRALNEQARAAYDETVANYRETVLTAFREVEDNLAALRQLSDEIRTETAAVDAAERSLQQARYRYVGGIVTYLEVVSTENAALAAQLSQVDIATQRMNASVLLVKALGGGWQAGDRVDLSAAAAPPSSAAK